MERARGEFELALVFVFTIHRQAFIATDGESFMRREGAVYGRLDIYLSDLVVVDERFND